MCRAYSLWFTEVEVLCFLELVFFLSHEGWRGRRWVCHPALPCVPRGCNHRAQMWLHPGPEILHSCVFRGIDSEGKWGGVIPPHMGNLAAEPPPGDDGERISVVESKALHICRRKHVDEIDTISSFGVGQREALDAIHKPRPRWGLGAHIDLKIYSEWGIILGSWLLRTDTYKVSVVL